MCCGPLADLREGCSIQCHECRVFTAQRVFATRREQERYVMPARDPPFGSGVATQRIRNCDDVVRGEVATI